MTPDTPKLGPRQSLGIAPNDPKLLSTFGSGVQPRTTSLSSELAIPPAIFCAAIPAGGESRSGDYVGYVGTVEKPFPAPPPSELPCLDVTVLSLERGRVADFI